MGVGEICCVELFVGDMGTEFWGVLCANTGGDSMNDQLRPTAVDIDVGDMDLKGVAGKGIFEVVFSSFVGAGGWVGFESQVTVR